MIDNISSSPGKFTFDLYDSSLKLYPFILNCGILLLLSFVYLNPYVSLGVYGNISFELTTYDIMDPVDG